MTQKHVPVHTWCVLFFLGHKRGPKTVADRNWIREVTLAFNQVGADSIIEIATAVSGPLQFELC